MEALLRQEFIRAQPENRSIGSVSRQIGEEGG